jgi:ATP-dependent helicase/nuclease subunit A
MLITPRFRQFNEAQRHALDTGRNLAVRAGAGSGKTSVLVERIVQLMAARRAEPQPLGLGAVVALTFTRKAAQQLQERLQEAFLERAGEGDADFWQARITELPTAMIGTIDAFCARVLRDLGHLDPQGNALSPGLEPLSAHDEAALKQEAVERVLDRLHSLAADAGDPEEGARAVAARWWGEHQGYATLIRHLVTLLNHVVDPDVIVAAHAAPGPVVERVRADWELLPAVRRLREDASLREDLERIVHDIDARNDAGERMDELRTRLLATLDALNSATPEGEARALDSLRDAFLNKDGSPRVQGLNKLAELVQPLQDAWCPLLERFSFDFDGEIRAREAADHLALLLEPVHEEYQRLSRAEGRYDFLTLARRTRDLLRRAPAARQALQERYRYLMVDEFQDTNHLQWEILSWLVGAGPEGALDADRLFLVGDPQQSIYRFRHADVSVFSRVQAAVIAANERHGHGERPTDYDRDGAITPATPEQRLGEMPLRENYRTLAPVPLEIVDRLFAYVFDPVVHAVDVTNPFEVKYQSLLAGLDANAGEVCYVLPRLPDDEEDDPDAEELPAESVALPQVQMVVDRLVARHGSPRRAARPGDPPILRWSDMAVLLPSRDVVLTELEREFRRRSVPFLVHKGIGFWQRTEVRDVVNLARALADPSDELSLFAVLRGPVGQLRDSEILFLSQLGRGKMTRGLDAIAVMAPVSDTLGDIAGWGELSDSARLALSEHWQSLSDTDRQCVCHVARRVQEWRQGVDRRAAAGLLEQILEESGAYAIYAAELEADAIFANLGKLFDTIRDLEARTPLGLTSLAYRLRDLVDEAEKEEQASVDPAADAVHIMTVHAAKGLEFPVVAVMKLDRRAVRPVAQRLRVLSPHDALLPVDREEVSRVVRGSLAVAVRHPRRPREMYVPRLLRALGDLDHAQALAESRRLFYVAATRARECLIVAGRQPRISASGKPIRMHECWQRWFEEALGITDDDKARGEWQDVPRGHRITIVTAPADTVAASPAPASVPQARLDLGAIAVPTALPVVRLDTLHAGLVGAVVQRVIREGTSGIRPTRIDAESLRPLAGELFRELEAEISQSSDPTRVADIAEAASVVLDRLARRDDSRLRALLTAEGLERVPFRLNLSDGVVRGCFDRLVTRGDGYEILAWTAGDADEESRLPLLALALWRSGRAALNEGRVLVHRVRIDSLELKTVGYPSAAMANAPLTTRRVDSARTPS